MECPWSNSKKQKKGTKNENTAMSEEAKVGGKLKLQCMAMGSSLQKIDRVES